MSSAESVVLSFCVEDAEENVAAGADANTEVTVEGLLKGDSGDEPGGLGEDARRDVNDLAVLVAVLDEEDELGENIFVVAVGVNVVVDERAEKELLPLKPENPLNLGISMAPVYHDHQYTRQFQTQDDALGQLVVEWTRQKLVSEDHES